MTATIVNGVICLVFSIIAAFVSPILVPALSAWLKSKTENEKLQVVISDIITTVQTSVNKYEQTVVARLKATGEWNAKSQRDVLECAIDEVVANLIDTTKESFINNGIDVSDVVERYVESYIQSKKSV
ncbi:MAG: hypothetical protein NC485_09850 [Ruminococcus flavefaciens]|nr:hypothetical protein [Ruminococcus flavefaciens]